MQDILTVTFGTIYAHLVDRKMLMSRVSALEDVADDRAEQKSQMMAPRQNLKKVNQGLATVQLQQTLWSRLSTPELWIRCTAFLKMAMFKV